MISAQLRRALVAGVIATTLGCSGKAADKPLEPSAKRDGGGVASGADELPVLPPAPPLPGVPAGLPEAPDHPGVTATAVALGELLFHDPRLSSTGKLACATCHGPAAGYSGRGRQDTASGKPNLRRAPALVNLAWVKELGWDGRYPDLREHLRAHIRGQLGDDLATSVTRLGELPLYRAHFTRAGGQPPEVALAALGAFVLTRYAGDAPWDRVERSPAPPADLNAGYQLFTTKAQCSVCHPPPLYTDLAFHRLGLIAVPDDGRGRIEPALKGAFRTPTLRNAAARATWFHDASAATLDAAIDWHLAGGSGQGADPSIVDPALKPVTLTASERGQLGAFVRALTAAAPAKPPTLP